MYCDFYQLTERPFNVTPDPKFLYLNARYREAIAALNYGISQRKGFISLIGEAGTGKTTLLKKILEDLDAKTRTVFIFNTNVTFEEILEYIFAEFDLPVLNGKKLYMLQRLNAFLLEELRSGRNVALLIDEAQDLELSVLEDLRLLSNLETAKEKILQIVLSGQPELGQKLSNPGLRQLRQRIGINSRLPPLSRGEVTEYIQYRLQATHCPDINLFTREAEDRIFHFSRGIPRLVNVVSDNALVIGYALGRKRIDADIIAEAATDLLAVEPQGADVREPALVVSAPPAAERRPNWWRMAFAVSAAVSVVLLCVLLAMGPPLLMSRHVEERQIAAAPPPPARPEVIRPGSEPRGTGVGHPVVPAVAAVEPADEGETAGMKLLPEGEALASVHAIPAAAPAEPPAETAEKQAALPKQAARASRESESPSKPEAVLPLPKQEIVAPPSESGAARKQEGEIPKAEAVVPQLQAAIPRSGENADAGAAVENGTWRLDGVQLTAVVVQAGDSISAIARRAYGQASYTILDLLELANPQLFNLDTISIGQTIRLPVLSEGFPMLIDGSGQYALLAFSTPQQRRAAALQSALSGHGFQTTVMSGSAGVGRPLYRVVILGSGGRDEVAGIGKQVQQVFREDSQLTRLGE